MHFKFKSVWHSWVDFSSDKDICKIILLEINQISSWHLGMTFERWSLLSRFWFLFNFRWGQCRISMHRGMCFPIFHHMTLKCWSFIGFGLSWLWLRWWTSYIDKIICKSVLWFRFYNLKMIWVLSRFCIAAEFLWNHTM